MLTTFLQYVLPSLIAAGVGLVVLRYTLRAQTSRDSRTTSVQLAEVTRDDSASLREDLMAERRQFLAEIKVLQDRCDALEQARCPLLELEEVKRRCDALEQTNREQAVELERQHKQNDQLLQELKNFSRGIVANVEGLDGTHPERT